MLEALPLIATPTIIVAMLSPEVREPTRKPGDSLIAQPQSQLILNAELESYLSRSLGLTLIAFAVLNLLLTGSISLVVRPPHTRRP